MLRRAVFSDVQRKALEKMFQKQKYISKPDRKKLAAKLGLKDSQVRGAPGGESRGGAGSHVPHLRSSSKTGEEKGTRGSCRAVSINRAKGATRFPAGRVGQEKPQPYCPWPLF